MVGVSKTPDAEFIALFEQYGATEAARRLGISARNVHSRRRNLEKKHQRKISPPLSHQHKNVPVYIEHPQRVKIPVTDGVVIVASDCHYWPNRISTAHRALVHFCAELKPNVVVMNGDVLDGATISRHPPIGWEGRPTLIDEIETCKTRLDEIERVTRGADHIWTLGNHDARFETRLATVAPEYARVHGVHLKDHFPIWKPAWSCWINDDLVIKHRWKGGMHATRNNALNAGKSMVTGHLHSQKVAPLTDYNGTRWGVDTGCIVDPYGPESVHYTEDSPVDWRSGFAVFTFYKGRLLMPELVTVFDKSAVEFRGKVIRV